MGPPHEPGARSRLKSAPLTRPGILRFLVNEIRYFFGDTFGQHVHTSVFEVL